MAFKGSEFLIDIYTGGAYVTIGGGKSASVSLDGSPQTASGFIGQSSDRPVPGSSVCSCKVSGSGVYLADSGYAALHAAKISNDAATFRIRFANSRQLIGSFYVTQLSRSGDMSSAENYSFSLTGHNITASSFSTYTPPVAGITWDSATMAANGVLTNDDYTFAVSTAVTGGVVATTAINSGKKYFEIVTSGVNGGYGVADRMYVGISFDTVNISEQESFANSLFGPNFAVIGNYDGFGPFAARVSADSYEFSSMNNGWNSGQTVGVAVDYVDKVVTFYKNGVSFGSIDLAGSDGYGHYITTTLTADWWPFAYTGKTGVTFTLQTATGELTYTPPTGFTALGD